MPGTQDLQTNSAELAHMLKPLKGLPFPVIIEAITGCRVIRVDESEPADSDLLHRIDRAASMCVAALRTTPIRRPRPNEVGNDVEPFVRDALCRAGLRAQKPTCRGGRGKATGYPDVLIYDSANRPTYLECKIYTAATRDTTMRSFYLSPSDSSKVTMDARHVLLAFEMTAGPVPDSRDSEYVPCAYTVADLHGLHCDVKYEFNADNHRLYAAGMVLRQG